MRYFFPLDAARFHGVIAPALAAAWSARSFVPCRDLCRELAEAAAEFVQHNAAGATVPLALQFAQNKSLFRKDLWRILVSEMLLLCAEEMPEIETPLATWAALLHQDLADDREYFCPIQQAIQGYRDLSFGQGFYRPDHAGWNDRPAVELVANWLSAVDVSSWRDEDLAEFAEEERADELEFAQEWFPALTAMYHRAAERGWVMVCEEM